MDYLTKSEEILLLAIWRLKKNAYGVTIRKNVGEVTGKVMSFGALYVSLDKLLKKGYVTKTPGDPSPERGGRRKNYYRLSLGGSRALQASRELNKALWNEVPEIAFKVK